MDESCVFCDILSGKVPGRFVYQDDAACAFLDIRPLRRGHTLVVPRRHVSDLTTDDAAEAVAAVGPALQKTARLLKTRLPADGVSLLQANGAAAGQEVFHLHFHLIPRWTADHPLTNWTADQTARDNLPATHHLLTT
ncbi:HIT family protein [Kribbella sp. NPDC026611]|uniref:HIT family protein n=1 Tax=Kribbella sp. NPDC026611 TaxID=3154911 RepID=UPI003411E9BB